jgi:predicted metalloprotease
MLRERLRDSSVKVVVRRIDSTDITAKGKILYGAAHFGEVTGEEARRRQLVEETVRARIEAVPNLFVTAIDAVRAGSGWSVRAEAVGPRVPSPEEIRGVERRAGRSVGEPIQVSLRAQVDLMVTGTRYEALGEQR